LDWTSSEAIKLLSFLLPGFVAAWVFYGLTPYPKPSQFERLIHALILTAVVNAIIAILKTLLTNESWTAEITLAWSVCSAFIVGVVFAWLANKDALHRLLRSLGITIENSFPSEWYSAFVRHRSYVVLHLAGKRRLYGWAEEWPSSPTSGHFLIVDGEWLTEGNKSIPLQGVDTIVVPAKDVEIVEFMETNLKS